MKEKFEAEYTAAVIDSVFQVTEDDNLPQQDESKLGLVKDACDASIIVGQIRILSSELVCSGSNGAPPYVIILSKWSDEQFLVAHFSPFSVPATETEMITGLNCIGLRVLQAWNIRNIPACLLKKSWLVKNADEEFLERSKALCHSVFTGDTLPDGFPSEKLGDRITEPNKLIEKYQKSEIERYQPLSDMIHSWVAGEEF